MKKPEKARWVVFSVLLAVAVWFLLPFGVAFFANGDSRMFIEGFLGKNFNYRDVFGSINSCYKKDVLKEGVLLRSNRYFSGWSCERVGDPDAIISLNYDPDDKDEHYCLQGYAKPLFGIHLNDDTVLDPDEYYDFLDDPRLLRYFCAYSSLIFDNIDQGKSTLLHCSAGRDRTGLMSAMVSATFIEIAVPDMDADKLASVLECDYQKTASLNKKMYGTVAQIYKSILAESGSMQSFLTDKCNISPQKISGAYQKALWRN